MNKKILLGFAACLLSTQVLALGVNGNIAAGKVKANTVCAACHGQDGNKTLDNTYPKLAGQYPDYLLKALKEYKSGKRSNAIMAGQAQALSDADMANLASYYGSLPSQLGIIK
jgi:cytochrome c553